MSKDKYGFSKEWCMEMAKLEEGLTCDITAGVPDKREKALEKLKEMAAPPSTVMATLIPLEDNSMKELINRLEALMNDYEDGNINEDEGWEKVLAIWHDFKENL